MTRRASGFERQALLVFAFAAVCFPFIAWAQDGAGVGAALGTLLVVGTIVVLAILGEPLFIILAALTAVCFLAWGDGYSDFESFRLFVVNIESLEKKNVLLAIPFFVVSGAIMSAGTIAARLIGLARALTGWMPGGLAVATVFACVFFSAISGSSPVTVIAIGSLMLPALLKAGFKEGFSLGTLTAAGSLGIIIPPSIPMLVYALVASNVTPVDVGEMFLAGVVPGMMLAGLLAAYCVVQGIRLKTPVEPFRIRAAWRAFREGVWALGLPLVILGGIYSGLFTPTEAAAVSVGYALLVELLIHQQLTFKKLADTLLESGIALGALLLIMVMSFALNQFLVEQQVPEQAATWIAGKELSPLEFVLALNLLLLLVGCLMDSISALLILTPLLVPIGLALGLDVVHLGIIFIVNLEIGYLTPPVGMNLFVASTVFKRPLGVVIRGSAPFVGLLAIGLVLMSYVPTFSLGLVNTFLRDADFYAAFPSERPKQEPAQAAQAAPEPIDAPAPQEGGVKTLAEMMEEAKRRRDAEGSEAAPSPAPPSAVPAEGKVMTLQEMMNEAKRRRDTEDAGSL